MKKLLQLVFTLGFLLFCFPLTTYAAQKDTKVQLTKEYVSATFHITSSTFSLKECDIYIVEPGGKTYTVQNVSEREARQSINNLKSGEWIVRITSQTLEEIGTIDLKVEGTKTELADADEKIQVAANLTGLKTYMKDNYIVCEWNESSFSVNVSVLDSKTLQVLSNQTISPKDGTYFEFKVPSEYREILVKVVPSTSASVTGAENSYTLDTYNNPNASVDFGQQSSVNLSEYEVKVVLEESYQVLLVSNGKEVERSEFLSAGEHLFYFPVKEGSNDYTLYIIDDKGYMKSFSYYLVGDFIAPELYVEQNAQSFTVNEPQYLIQGTIKDYHTLTVNDKTVENIYDDGLFEYDYQLHEGENLIEVVATDIAGNQTVCDLTITYVIPEESPYALIIGGVVGILVLAIVVFLVVKKLREYDFSPREREVKKSKKRVNELEEVEYKKPIFDIQFQGKLSWLITPIILIVLYFILTHFLIAQIIISSSSMEPTLKTGTLVFFNRLAYVVDEIERGDVVCFWSEEENVYMGKRIIGLPGDLIQFQDGYVMINGEYMDESMYVMYDSETNCDKEFNVPDGHYFVLGDNREVSKDSRFFTEPYIAEKDILGKYIGSSGFNISNFSFFNNKKGNKQIIEEHAGQ